MKENVLFLKSLIQITLSILQVKAKGNLYHWHSCKKKKKKVLD